MEKVSVHVLFFFSVSYHKRALSALWIEASFTRCFWKIFLLCFMWRVDLIDHRKKGESRGTKGSKKKIDDDVKIPHSPCKGLSIGDKQDEPFMVLACMDTSVTLCMSFIHIIWTCLGFSKLRERSCQHNARLLISSSHTITQIHTIYWYPFQAQISLPFHPLSLTNNRALLHRCQQAAALVLRG